MNVLFLDQYSALGGGQRCLLDIVEETLARNWAATVALPGDGCFAEALRRMDVDVVSIPCGPYRSERKAAVDVLRFGSDFAAQYRLLRGLMRTGRFDLVYVNGPRLLPAAVAAHQAIPILFHAHSLPLQRTARMRCRSASRDFRCCRCRVLPVRCRRIPTLGIPAVDACGSEWRSG